MLRDAVARQRAEAVSRVRLKTTLTAMGETTVAIVQCPPPKEREPDRRADLGEMAARTTVDEVMGPVATCVTTDVSLARVRELFATTRQRAVAVVDGDGRLEGLISRTDLVNAPAIGTAADVMSSPVHALPEHAPLAYVVGLLAHEDLGEVPIVTADGTVTGICHALDVVRWLAAR
jgi:CBS domain-containing protein